MHTAMGDVPARSWWARNGRRLVVLSGLGGILVLGCVTRGLSAPLINDISTDLDDVPAFVHAPTLKANANRDMTFPEAFKASIKKSYADLATLELDTAPAEAYDAALRVAKDMKRWRITHEDPKAMTFEGVATTPLMRFRDDFVVRVRPGKREGAARVDMRSKSRVGKGDLGANAKRIRTFFSALREEMAL